MTELQICSQIVRFFVRKLLCAIARYKGAFVVNLTDVTYVIVRSGENQYNSKKRLEMTNCGRGKAAFWKAAFFFIQIL